MPPNDPLGRLQEFCKETNMCLVIFRTVATQDLIESKSTDKLTIRKD